MILRILYPILLFHVKDKMKNFLKKRKVRCVLLLVNNSFTAHRFVDSFFFVLFLFFSSSLVLLFFFSKELYDRLHGKPVIFNDEGKLVEYTDKIFLLEVNKQIHRCVCRLLSFRTKVSPLIVLFFLLFSLFFFFVLLLCSCSSSPKPIYDHVQRI